MNFAFDYFAHIDRTFRCDSKSLIFINNGHTDKLWEANKVRQPAITESQRCDIMSEHSPFPLLHVEALHFPDSDPPRYAFRLE